jgi:hypothetical protein
MPSLCSLTDQIIRDQLVVKKISGSPYTDNQHNNLNALLPSAFDFFQLSS